MSQNGLKPAMEEQKYHPQSGNLICPKKPQDMGLQQNIDPQSNDPLLPRSKLTWNNNKLI